MKKGFLLVEVIISIMLISGVVLTLFQIKSINFSFLEKINDNKETNISIILTALNNKEVSIKNQKFYLTDIVELRNDEIRKKFKNISVNEKIEKIDTKEILSENLSIKMEIYESKYSIDNLIDKTFFTLQLN